MDETTYNFGDIFSKKIVLLADIHERKMSEIFSTIEGRCVDYIFLPGDFVDGKKILSTKNHNDIIKRAICLLDQCAKIAPTYFSLGNHEKLLSEQERELLRGSRAVALYDEYVQLEKGLMLGGLSSGRTAKRKQYEPPDCVFINEFAKTNGYKILLCHHPEYYNKYLVEKGFDVILSGHAHGGQIRIANRGLYAPGQGFFPKYTSGKFDNMVVSRGIAGTEFFPRINNKSEIVYINI